MLIILDGIYEENLFVNLKDNEKVLIGALLPKLFWFSLVVASCHHNHEHK